MKLIKRIIKLFAILIIGLLLVYSYGLYINNQDVDSPDERVLQQQLEQAVLWLVKNEDTILSQTNPMLWWMLHETHKLSDDSRIADLLTKYHNSRPRIKHSIWGPLFDAEKHAYLDDYSVLGLPYYNQHFIYALNCAPNVAATTAVVKQQNEAGFCHQANYVYRPACTTHQLMGIHFLATKKCQFLDNIDEVNQALQQDIVFQLTWDIRVIDVYLQRVLMLLITGAEANVEPIWIQRVLDHQLSDGGWGNFNSLVDMGDGRALGFSSRIITVGREKSTFHATAQGVYILSHLLASNQSTIEVTVQPSDNQ